MLWEDSSIGEKQLFEVKPLLLQSRKRFCIKQENLCMCIFKLSIIEMLVFMALN